MANQQTPPIPNNFGTTPPRKKKNTKTIVIVVLAVIFVPFIIASIVKGGAGTHSDVGQLQSDSIALEGNFLPKHEYTDVSDIYKAVDSIYALGRPTRFSLDSVEINENQHLKALAAHNKSKCDSVLVEVLPTWRRVATYAIQVQEGTNSARLQVVGENYDQIKFISPKFIDDEKSKDMYLKYVGLLKLLGFKQAVFELAPNNEVLSFDVK